MRTVLHKFIPIQSAIQVPFLFSLFFRFFVFGSSFSGFLFLKSKSLNEKRETESQKKERKKKVIFLLLFIFYLILTRLTGSVVHYVIVPSIGLFSFLALGLSLHIVRFWNLLIRLLLERKYADVKELLTNEKALSKMSSGSGSHSHSHDEKPGSGSGGPKVSSATLTSNSIQIPPPMNTPFSSSEISDIELADTSNPSPGTSS